MKKTYLASFKRNGIDCILFLLMPIIIMAVALVVGSTEYYINSSTMWITTGICFEILYSIFLVTWFTQKEKTEEPEISLEIAITIITMPISILTIIEFFIQFSEISTGRYHLYCFSAIALACFVIGLIFIFTKISAKAFIVMSISIVLSVFFFCLTMTSGWVNENYYRNKIYDDTQQIDDLLNDDYFRENYKDTLYEEALAEKRNIFETDIIEKINLLRRVSDDQKSILIDEFIKELSKYGLEHENWIQRLEKISNVEGDNSSPVTGIISPKKEEGDLKSVLKYNSGSTVTYKVVFMDENAVTSISLDKDMIVTVGFDADVEVVELSKNESYEIVLKNIKGTSGKKWITIKEGAAADESGNKTLRLPSGRFYLQYGREYKVYISIAASFLLVHLALFVLVLIKNKKAKKRESENTSA